MKKIFKVSAYNEETHTGILRHIVVKKVGISFIVIIVATSNKLPALSYLQELLKVYARSLFLLRSIYLKFYMRFYMSLILIGPPSCGKSTIGVILAKKYGFKFID